MRRVLWKTRPVTGFDYTKHLSIIVPVVATVALMIEVYGVSDFSVTSSLAILSAAGPGQVAAGAVFTLVPYLLPVIALLAIAWLARMRATGAHPDRMLLAGALALTAVLLSAWQNLLVVGLGVLAYGALFTVLVRVLPGRLLRDEDAMRRPRLGPVALVALMGAFLASLDDPWVAPEVVTIKSTPAVVAALEDRDGFVRSGDQLRGVAYPLDTDAGSQTYLVRTTRRVLHVPAEAVVARSVCRYELPGHHAVLLDQLLGRDDPTPNPPCPSEDELGG